MTASNQQKIYAEFKQNGLRSDTKIMVVAIYNPYCKDEVFVKITGISHGECKRFSAELTIEDAKLVRDALNEFIKDNEEVRE